MSDKTAVQFESHWRKVIANEVFDMVYLSYLNFLKLDSRYPQVECHDIANDMAVTISDLVRVPPKVEPPTLWEQMTLFDEEEVK